MLVYLGGLFSYLTHKYTTENIYQHLQVHMINKFTCVLRFIYHNKGGEH